MFAILFDFLPLIAMAFLELGTLLQVLSPALAVFDLTKVEALLR